MELKQRTTASPAPFGLALRPDVALFDELVHDPHHGRQADAEPLRNGRSGDWAFPPHNLQDRKTVNPAHLGSGDSALLDHGVMPWVVGTSYLHDVIITNTELI